MTNRPQGIQIVCPNCRQPFSAVVESIVDGGRDPAAKARFLSRRTNLVQCPYCGAPSQLSIPLVYHDHTKELLLIYFPMELNLPQPERERIIGEMTKAVMNSLPPDQRKGYLLKPTFALTLDGMIETILSKDGITPEMVAAQKEKMKQVEAFVAADPSKVADMVAQQDDQIDDEFLQLMTLAAEAAASTGRQAAAEAILARRDEIISLSSYGKELIAKVEQQEAAVQEVAERLQGMANNQLTSQKLVDYALEISDSDDKIQAMVGLIRPAFDYNFFTALSQQIDKTKDKAQAEKLTRLRERLLELTQMIDQQQQMMIQQAQAVLRDLLNAPNLEQAIAERLPMIDDMFLSVLSANIQAAEQRGDLLLGARLKDVYEKVMNALQASAPPEVRFINELLRQEDPLEARLLLTERAKEFGQPLLNYMDALIRSLTQREADHLVERLVELREAAAKVVGH